MLKLYAAGDLHPVPLILPIPESAPQAMKVVGEFFRLYHGLRLTACDERPVPFACDWVGRKTGLPPVTAWRAIQKLIEAGVLHHAETLPGRQKLGTYCYLPGKAS